MDFARCVPKRTHYATYLCRNILREILRMSNHRRYKQYLIAKSVTIRTNDVCTQTDFTVFANREVECEKMLLGHHQNKSVKIRIISFFVYNSIEILHQNINGLINKSDILTVCLDDMRDMGKNIDILCFTKYNMILNDICYLRIPGFDIAACYASKSRDSGSCILVRSGIKFKVIEYIEKFNIPNVFEHCGIEVNELKIVILCVYRVPKTTNATMCLQLF